MAKIKKDDNSKELMETLNNFDYSNYNKKVKQFEEKIGLCESGKASKYVCFIRL